MLEAQYNRSFGFWDYEMLRGALKAIVFTVANYVRR